MKFSSNSIGPSNVQQIRVGNCGCGWRHHIGVLVRCQSRSEVQYNTALVPLQESQLCPLVLLSMTGEEGRRDSGWEKDRLSWTSTIRRPCVVLILVRLRSHPGNLQTAHPDQHHRHPTHPAPLEEVIIQLHCIKCGVFSVAAQWPQPPLIMALVRNSGLGTCHANIKSHFFPEVRTTPLGSMVHLFFMFQS